LLSLSSVLPNSATVFADSLGLDTDTNQLWDRLYERAPRGRDCDRGSEQALEGDIYPSTSYIRSLLQVVAPFKRRVQTLDRAVLHTKLRSDQ